MTLAVSDDEKRLALSRILQSRTFGRSDQLRAFLRYVCEAELAGRAHQLNEYALGVSVLGRPEGYSPAEDSSVRSRAYELRNKLKSYYSDEAPEEPIQITIDKGAYVPRFDRRAASESSRRSAEAIPTHAALVERAAPEARSLDARRRLAVRSGVISLVAGVVLTLFAIFLFWESRAKPVGGGLTRWASTREMEALWRPFLDDRTALVISFEVRLFLWAPPTGLVIRDARTNHEDEIAKSKLLNAFRERMGAEELVATYDYADFGAVRASFLLSRILDRAVGLTHSSALGWQDVWNSNVIFIGSPDANPMIRRVFGDADLDFVDGELGSAVRNLRPLPGEPREYLNAATHGAGKKYGVISVLPGPRPGHHIMILTGSGAELVWALAESVADPSRVKELMSHVLASSGECPAIFQVVIEATFESNVPIGIRYVTHHVYRAR
ncbi:MAG TPA: hypothetical protein VHG72_10140 [Polyangia bacterium]|nr:hypothetical protein [Polyangia bacterium]